MVSDSTDIRILLLNKYRLAVERVIDGIIRLFRELRVGLGLGRHDT